MVILIGPPLAQAQLIASRIRVFNSTSWTLIQGIPQVIAEQQAEERTAQAVSRPQPVSPAREANPGVAGARPDRRPAIRVAIARTGHGVFTGCPGTACLANRYQHLTVGRVQLAVKLLKLKLGWVWVVNDLSLQWEML